MTMMIVVLTLVFNSIEIIDVCNLAELNLCDDVMIIKMRRNDCILIIVSLKKSDSYPTWYKTYTDSTRCQCIDVNVSNHENIIIEP